MLKNANWIISEKDFGNISPVFKRKFYISKKIKTAMAIFTACGVYNIFINGRRVSNYILTPGWTNYDKRLQYQSYDISDMLQKGENLIKITVGNGWFRGKICNQRKYKFGDCPAIIGKIEIHYASETDVIYTDEYWEACESKILFSDIYNGEIYDSTYEGKSSNVKIADYPKDILIPHEGEFITENKRISVVKEIITPKGEKVLDFGQEISGYVEINLKANKGEVVSFSFAEVLDNNGCFYNENYRDAKCIYKYICKDGIQRYKPETTYYGFRYIRIDAAPKNFGCDNVTAIVIHSDMMKTGHISTENKLVDKLFRNIEWGQIGNFIDIPTDCPQRDERLGWTGDAEMFIKTALYQYDCKKFFLKWLNDMVSEQYLDGKIPKVIPDVFCDNKTSAAWGDAIVICPWVLYEMTGDKSILKKYFNSMISWVNFIESNSKEKNLWITEEGYGDWLGLDSSPGSYMGSSRVEFISSAYYKYSVDIVAKAARIIGENFKFYEEKAALIRKEFIRKFPECYTQTEYVIALRFNLTDKKSEFAEKLVWMINNNGNRMTTGFIGTPHLLFALSENGYIYDAYSLLLQEKYPSWLYSVKKGATTIWEHWDGIREDGTFWSPDMNSFNHYTYGAVAEWVYSVAAGIIIDEKGIRISPHPDPRLGVLSAEYDSVYGKIISEWKYVNGNPVYNITIPVKCSVVINGKEIILEKGTYTF